MKLNSWKKIPSKRKKVLCNIKVNFLVKFASKYKNNLRKRQDCQNEIINGSHKIQLSIVWWFSLEWKTSVSEKKLKGTDENMSVQQI